MSVYQDETEIEVEPEADENLEDNEFEIDGETAKDKIAALRKKLKDCEIAKANNLEDLQRAKAEFLNSRRRLEEEMNRTSERQINSFIEKLMPLADSFSLAMNDRTAWEAIDKNWRVGVEGIYAQLQSLLKDYSVITINETGVDFNPEKHEAVANVAVTGEADNHKVISIVQTGYEREVNGKRELIRPARVTVGEFTSN